MKLDTVEMPYGTVIHYSVMEGGVSVVCGEERKKGDYWSQYQEHITCQKCQSFLRDGDHDEKG